MLLFYSCFLTICYLWGAYKGRKDIFSPRFLFNSFAWLKNIPYFTEYAAGLSEHSIDVYFLYKFISFLCVNFGITFYERHFKRTHFAYYERKTVSSSKYLKLAIILALLGLAIKLYVFSTSGGILYILTHIQSRKALMAGKYYYELLANSSLTLAVLFSQLYYLKVKTRKAFHTYIIILAATLLSLIVFGARKPAVMLLIQNFMLYHFVSNRFSIRSLFKLKYLSIIFAVCLFIIMMPMLRQSEETNLILNPKEWVTSAIKNSNSLLSEFSYCEGDVFVFDYFEHHDFWLGQSYKNIFVQWIPSSFYPNKPPMDDGMYLYNMMMGESVSPNDATQSLYYQTSIPFTLEGALFSNFGVVGIIFGAFLVGILYAFVYKVLIETHSALLILLLYKDLMFVFVPSVLHITSVLISFGVNFILLYLLLGFKFKKYHQ